MQTGIDLGEVRLDPIIRREIQQPERVDIASVATVHELNFEAPVKSGCIRI